MFLAFYTQYTMIRVYIEAGILQNVSSFPHPVYDKSGLHCSLNPTIKSKIERATTNILSSVSFHNSFHLFFFHISLVLSISALACSFKYSEYGTNRILLVALCVLIKISGITPACNQVFHAQNPYSLRKFWVANDEFIKIIQNTQKRISIGREEGAAGWNVRRKHHRVVPKKCFSNK